MNKLKILNKIKDIYDKNGNIMEYLRKSESRDYNTLEDIMISYDFQAGSYLEWYKKDSILKDRYNQELYETINKIGEYNSILEVGVGDGITLGPLLKLLKKDVKGYGFDISWSRVKCAQEFMKELNLKNTELFVGDLFNCPIKDDSIDIVYTSHSIEPNSGREEKALQELYRITKKYLILLEPDYVLADELGKKRMLEMGYITQLYDTAKKLGYKIVEHRRLDIQMNSLNPTSIIVIEKDVETNVPQGENVFCCPITQANLIQEDNAYFSPDSLIAYPIIKSIPCLTQQNGVIATQF